MKPKPLFLEEQGLSARLLDDYHVVDFMHHPISGHHITFSNTSVADHGPTIAIDAKALLVDRLNSADERPLGWHKSSAAQNIYKINVRERLIIIGSCFIIESQFDSPGKMWDLIVRSKVSLSASNCLYHSSCSAKTSSLGTNRV